MYDSSIASTLGTSKQCSDRRHGEAQVLESLLMMFATCNVDVRRCGGDWVVVAAVLLQVSRAKLVIVLTW